VVVSVNQDLVVSSVNLLVMMSPIVEKIVRISVKMDSMDNPA